MHGTSPGAEEAITRLDDLMDGFCYDTTNESGISRLYGADVLRRLTPDVPTL